MDRSGTKMETQEGNQQTKTEQVWLKKAEKGSRGYSSDGGVEGDPAITEVYASIWNLF